MVIFFRILQLCILYTGLTYICYVPFSQHLKFSQRKTIALLVSSFLVSIIIYICFLIFISNKASMAWFLISIPLFCLLFLYSIEDSYYKILLIFLFVLCYGTFVSGASVLVANSFFEKSVKYEVLYTIVYLFLGSVTYLPIHSFEVKNIVPLVHNVKDEDLKNIYFMPLPYIIIQIVFFIVYDTFEKMSSTLYFILWVCATVSTYFVIINILEILKNSIEKTRMIEAISTGNRLLEIQKKQYTQWIQQVEDIRRAKHDLKHHVSIIQNFLDNSDKNGLQKYLDNFRALLPDSKPFLLCRNMVVNSLLISFYERALEEDIKFEVMVDISDNILINSQDLAIIFGNCLENAFEACARITSDLEKKVAVMAKPVGNSLAIIIDNTFDGTAIKMNDVYLSSKRDKQVGIGMASVKLIAEKYSGIVSFETDSNLFMTSIRLGCF